MGAKNVRKWYYDACALDNDCQVYSEILGNIRSDHHILSITSHLGIGEAHSNCRRKGEEVASAFIGLIDSLGYNLELVGNDNIERELEIVREILPSLSITDAIHLATALNKKCENLRTSDPDLFNIPRRKIQEVSEKCGCTPFAITKIEFKKR